MESISDQHNAVSKLNDGDVPQNAYESLLIPLDIDFGSIYNDDMHYDYDSIGEYFFESARLAYKTNSDYKDFVQALVKLEAERGQAQKDLNTLSVHRKRAATSPLHYVEKIEAKEEFGVTKARKVGLVSDIDYDKDIVSRDFNFSDDYMNGNLSTTDKSCSEGDHSIFKAYKPWTRAEQLHLEHLLLTYPPEEIESRRWEKIACALGTRTPNQVASRVQKYFIKLVSAGVPIPGRQPNPKYIAKSTASHRHGKASVLSNNGEDENSKTSMATSGDGDLFSEKDMKDINPKLKNTPEYQELLLIRKVLQKKLSAVKLRNSQRGYVK